MAQSIINLLNGIRANASTDYTDRIPAATRTNIQTVGNALADWTPGKDIFFGELIEKIGLTRVHQDSFRDKFEIFRGKMLENGAAIEDIYIDLLSSEDFDGTDTNPHSQKKPTINTEYHKIDRRLKYQVTVSDDQVRNSFKSLEGVNNLINAIVAKLEDSMNKDNYTMAKELIGQYQNYKTVENTSIPADPSTAAERETYSVVAKQFLTTIKKASKDFTYINDDYNEAGYEYACPKARQVLFVHKDIMSSFESYVFGDTFNFEQLLPGVEMIEVDDFGTDDEGTYAILMDKEAVVSHYSLLKTTSLYNPSALTTNYWKHVWQFMSLRTFKHKVRFVNASNVNAD